MVCVCFSVCLFVHMYVLVIGKRFIYVLHKQKGSNNAECQTRQEHTGPQPLSEVTNKEIQNISKVREYK